MNPRCGPIAVLSGDRREAWAFQVLRTAGYEVRGFGLAEPAAEACLPSLAQACRGAEAVVAPVLGVGEDGVLARGGPGQPAIRLEAVLPDLAGKGLLFLGAAGPAARRIVGEFPGIRVIELLTRDDFAYENAVPTAEGAILSAISRSERTIAESRSVVLGAGRCGLVLARALSGLGGHVTVVARRTESRAKVRALAMEAVGFQELGASLEGADFVFNTVPAPVLGEEKIQRLPDHAVIVDVASAPGGTDFAAAERHGVRAALEPGLPGRIAPYSAGRAIARVVDAVLHGGDPGDP